MHNQYSDAPIFWRAEIVTPIFWRTDIPARQYSGSDAVFNEWEFSWMAIHETVRQITNFKSKIAKFGYLKEGSNFF